MSDYIALIHKDPDGCYGVSFPDLPGVITGGDTIEEAMESAADLLTFAAEDWHNPDGTTEFPLPRTIEELRADPDFVRAAADAIVATVPFGAGEETAE